MAQATEDEKTGNDNSDNKLYDLAKEDKVVKEVLEMGLLEIDDKTGKEVLNPDTVWTVYNTKDDAVKVIYRMVGDSGVYTIRGKTRINISLKDIYDFMDPESDMEQEFSMEIDKLMKEWRLVKQIDKDHRVCYSSFSTGFPTWMIWPRDFCWIKRRVKFENYKIGDVSHNAVLSFSYSIDDKHPDYVATQASHVRGFMDYSAYIFYQDVNDKDENTCNLVYIVAVDPGGKIPQKVVNYSAPAQGMNVKGYVDNLEKLKAALQKYRDAQKANADAAAS